MYEDYQKSLYLSFYGHYYEKGAWNQLPVPFLVAKYIQKFSSLSDPSTGQF